MLISRTAGERAQSTGAEYFERLPVAAVVLDVGWRCRHVNAAARRLFAPRDVEGVELERLFAGWIGAPRAAELAAPQAALPVARSAEGRAYGLHCAPDGDGGTLLTLFDLTTHLSTMPASARDDLTGLLLRASFQAGMDVLLAEAGAQGRSLAVLHLDLDRFKVVNDTLGHAFGDALLVKVAERLAGVVRAGDLVARLGGDEFMVVQAQDATPDSARVLAERIADLIGRTYVLRGHTINIGASVGVSMFPVDGRNTETLARHADLALYHAKAEARGTVRFFEPAMNARMEARRAMEVDLRRALALRQFHLAYQPLVTLSSGRIEGLEALLRWNHPTRGLVSPADFIPLAEEIGLIGPIGEWVLRTACREAASWPSPVGVAVNISPMQFKSGKLAETVASALAQSGLAPTRLEIEITEGALLDETAPVLECLRAIQSLGVRVAMDDFGTGYSSLSYLRKFPFDTIKIDQSFVRGLGGDADCDAIVRAVARLGSSLGMRTTAEGVETADQLERIRSEGCTQVQGYLTGRPMPGEAVSALLRQQSKEDPDA